MFRFKEIYEIWRRDNSLAQALGDSYRMLDKTHEMFRASVRLLRDGPDAGTGADVYEEDRIINEYQVDVRRKVLRYLAVTGTTDLIPGLVLTSIVIDLERIGDYTKNITELAIAREDKLSCGAFENRVVELETLVEQLFEELRPLLQSPDRERARALSERTGGLRKQADGMLIELIRGTDESLGRGETATVALYVRYLKRIGAHLLNILSSIVNPFERIGYREQDLQSD